MGDYTHKWVKTLTLRSVRGQRVPPNRLRGNNLSDRSPWHGACLFLFVKRFLGPTPIVSGGRNMKWTKPEFEVVELGMEVGAYAGNA